MALKDRAEIPPTELAVGPPGAQPGAGRPGAVQASAEPDGPGTVSPVIGPYRLLQLIGSGGMGEVWLAEQTEPVRRTVAVKVIKRGMDTRRVIRRFQAERQALAMMDHPAIAKVFDAGETPHGRPYFVMEYVRGVPITDYCDRHRLTTGRRLELFLQLCDGVQHAHHKAVLHRDLKPSNLLVTELDGKPVPKIIDFGVAKAMAQPLTQETMYTELGQIIGTPEYMSPEQADLTGEDVDTRTDVYSLGVVLYQLLVGTLPFDSRAMRQAGPEGIRRMLRDEDPERPSTRVATLGEASAPAAANRGTEPPALARQLAGDLDWITLKALEKDRNRRYGSPQELAADLGRYLRNEPVEARPPTTAYRLAKFTRRHRTGVAVAATLLILLLGFAVAMAVQTRRVTRERDQKERALAEAEAVTAFLSDMLASVDPGKQGRNVTVRELLEDARTKLGDAFAGSPEVASRLQVTLGLSYSALGLYDTAEEELLTAYEARSRLLGPDHPKTLAAAFALASVVYNRGRYAEAEKLYRTVLEGRRRVLGNDDNDTLWAVGNLAMALAAQGRYSEAEPLLVEALAARRRTLGLDHKETLVLINNLATVYHNLGRYAEAEPLYREALAAKERIVGAKNPTTLAARQNLAELMADQGRLAEAEPQLAEVLAEKREVFGDDHPSTLYTAGVLARVYSDEGRFDLAEPLLLDTLAGQRRRLGPEHEQTLATQRELAEAYRRAGRPAAAEPLLLSTLETARRTLGEDHPATLATLHELACLRAAQGRRAEALDLLRRALRPGAPLRAPFADPALRALRGDPEFAALEASWRNREAAQ